MFHFDNRLKFGQNMESVNENALIKNSSSEDHWTILRHVYTMLVDANVLNTSASEKIVEFKFPDEIMVSNRLLPLLFGQIY